MYTCSVSSCRRPNLRGASCLLCERRFCVEHLGKEYHPCPDRSIESEQRAYYNGRYNARIIEINKLIASLNLDALCARASSLKGGVRCEIPPLVYDEHTGYTMMGDLNYHFPLIFDDGDTWICRVRRVNVNTPPKAIENVVVQSEVATLQFLHSIGVPVPQVHDFGLHTPTNPLSTAYILMDRVDGKPLRWFEVDEEDKKHILEQFADIFIKLSDHPFNAIGGLQQSGDAGTYAVGPFTAYTSFLADLHPHGAISLLGPYDTYEMYLRAVLERTLEYIHSGKGYVENRVDNYLLHKYLYERIPDIVKATNTDDGFCLKHLDDKGNHILVDERNNIVGVIDWEWAQTVPKAIAFAAPIFIAGTRKYFLDEDMELSSDETALADILDGKGKGELAMLVRNGRLQHRIWRSIFENKTAENLPVAFTSLQKSLFGVDKAVLEWAVWKEPALARYKDDAGLQRLLSEAHPS
ncbi:unnamed protein product [Somion occarium]|uniref:Aminoglycoside phosphotransferase domain-containing protein n=1 Tax=Somion occarium TaxID=3059160 RepID=A0ABP1DL95_9APHY